MSPDSAASSSSSAARLSSNAFKIHNVCRLLTRRSHGFYTKDAGVAHRKNMGILRKLVCQKSTKFKNVWTTHSTSPIAYEHGRIYFDNYRCCVSSIAREPRILYQLPACSKSEKIEDALLLECPLEETLPSPPDYKSSLAVLTAHNWLLRLSANTGEILEKIYLPPYCKFRYLSWDTPQEIMVVKSAQHKFTAAAQQAGIQQSVLFFLAVFRVLPLKFIGMLEINKKIFGNNVTDVAFSHGMLIVMSSVGLVRLYSFQSISEQFTEQKFDLGCKCNWNGKVGIVGKYPFGLPCNIKITDTPPLLFEVSSLENSFQIGGYPWHYIITPNKKKHKGVFHICALKDNVLMNNSVTVTASGRVVKKRFNVLDDDPEQETFKIVDYEDELDLLSVVAVTQTGADGKAHLDLHCNEHGILLKSIPLAESWDVTYNHEVYFDRDIVLHIEQKPNRIFICYLYQMVCDTFVRNLNHSCLS
uniref:DDB1 and CUL4 associated factor 17 n=1 Tax=Chelonoidis abingdonii TaxID=106734 RepID=A0A8C0G8B5_CHEAB